MPIEESIAKLDAATAALIHSVEVNESMVDTVTERLDDQDDIIEALPEVSVTETEDIFEFPDMNDLHIIRDGIDAKIAVNTNAISTLSSGIASLSADLASTKKALKIEQRNVENLRALLKDTDYKDVVDRRELHSKTLGDAEVCGDDTQVLPNGELLSVGGRTVVWNQQIVTPTISFTLTEDKTNCWINPFTSWRSKSLLLDGHKYYGYVYPALPTGVNIANAGNSGQGIGVFTASGNVYNSISFAIIVYNSGTLPAGTYQYTYHIIDLTQMFGAGNEPATVDAFEAMIDTSKYHPYNAGTLMSLPTKQVVIKDSNIFDPLMSWIDRDGYTSSGIKYNHTDNVIIMNGTRASTVSGSLGIFNYAVFEDGKRYVASIFNEDGTVPDDVSMSSTEYKTRISFTGGRSGMITVVASIPGKTYVNRKVVLKIEEGTGNGLPPKCRSTLVVPQSVKSRTGYGWSAGTSKNSIYWNDEGRLIERIEVGKLNLESLTWIKENTYGRFVADAPSDVKVSNRSTTLVSNRYDCIKNGEIFDSSWDKKIYTYSTSIYIHDSSYSDVTSFKNSLHELFIMYPLLNPIETDITDLLSPNFDNLLTNLETGGTVTFVADGVDPSGTVVLTDAEQSIPVPNSIAYQTKIAS